MTKEELQNLLIETAEKHCIKNYEFGFDWFVECYDKKDWIEFFELYEVDSLEKLIPALNESAGNTQDQQSNTGAFWICDKCDSENTRENPKVYCDCHPSYGHLAPTAEERFFAEEERKSTYRLRPFQPITQ